MTYHQSYVESVWWCLKNLFDRGSAVPRPQDRLVVGSGRHGAEQWRSGAGLPRSRRSQRLRPFSAAGSTRPGDGRQPAGLDDDALDACRATSSPPSIRSWSYATVVDPETGQRLILAEALVETLAEKIKRAELQVQQRALGRSWLAGATCRRSTSTIVSQGTASGRPDGRQRSSRRLARRRRPTSSRSTAARASSTRRRRLAKSTTTSCWRSRARFVEGEGPELICAVAPDGKFTDEAPTYDGRWVKDGDKEITRDLKQRELLFHQEQYLHDYPFCWRAEEDPLIQYPRRSWFVRTTQFKDQMLANNQQINWLPEHIRDGRFGNFLETQCRLGAVARTLLGHAAADLGLRRRRAQMEAIGSYDELLAKPGVQGTEVWERGQAEAPELPDDLRVHKPYIDAVTYDSPFAAGARMQRVSEVIDCWFDSGAMPFAQWGYPHQRTRRVRRTVSRRFHQRSARPNAWLVLQPAGDQHADVRRATDQTDAADTTLASVSASVSQLHRAGTDAGRRRRQDVQEQAELSRAAGDLRSLRRRCAALVLLRQSAALDVDSLQRAGDQGQHSRVPAAAVERLQLLRDLRQHRRLSIPAERIAGDVGQLTVPDELAEGDGYRPRAETQRTGSLDPERAESRRVRSVVQRMDAYDNFAACGHLHAFVDALSNWYVRRSRDRYLEQRQAVAGQAGCLLDAVRMPAHDRQADRPVHAVSGRVPVAESGPASLASASLRERPSV